MNTKLSIENIIKFLDDNNYKYEFIGNHNLFVEGFSTITNYKHNTITWLKNKEKYLGLDNEIFKIIKLVIAPIELIKTNDFKNVIFVQNPKEVFFAILSKFYIDEQKISISTKSVISKSAIIGINVTIGDFCTIGDNVFIDEGTIIENNVDIKSGVKIGKNCTIKSGAIIGGRGFGYSQDEDGSYISSPHFGSVVIGDYVDIGSNTCIDRGTIDDTVIMDGVKIDNLCHIAHNVVIGKNSMLITQAKVYGSCVIGNNCYISTSIIRNQVKLGDNVTVGMGSVVTKDIESGKVVFGIPAKEKK